MKLFTPPSGHEFQKHVFITNRFDIYELVNNKLIWSSHLESLHATTKNLIMVSPPNAGHGLTILEVSWSHTMTHHSW